MWSKMIAERYAPLPLTVVHNELEPATSLASRLAARNGVLSVQEFCRDIRFPYVALVAGESTAMELLAQLSGSDVKALAFASIRNLGGNAFRLRDEVANSQSLQRSRLRVCPACLLNDVGDTQEIWRAWRRIHWQFVSMRSCVRHDLKLITLPPEQATLRGYDFTAQLRKHWPLINQSYHGRRTHTSFEKWLTSRVSGKREGVWLDQLELNVASRACEVLGLRLLEGPKAKLSGHCSDKWADYADVGYSVLRDGEEALRDALSDMLSDRHVDRRFPSKVYGPLTTWLNGRGLGEEYEPLKAIVRAHIFTNFKIRRGVLVLGLPSVGKTGNTVSFEAAGLSKQFTMRMVQRGLANKRQRFMAGKQPHETRPGDTGVEHGHRIPCATKGLYPSHGSWIAILFS